MKSAGSDELATSVNGPGPSLPAPETLSSEQIHALFDILTHSETYAEVQAFGTEAAVKSFGYPFEMAPIPSGLPEMKEPGTTKSTELSGSPILQLLLRFVLNLPGISYLPPDFWNVKVQALLTRLGEANLSDSYDKGAMGTRKVLGTAASSVLEMLGRGALGGLNKDSTKRDETDYNLGKAEDLERAWNDVLQGLVYGNLVDELFDHFKSTPELESFSPTVEAAVKYIVFHLATLLHHIFVVSPNGQYLLKLIERAHSMIPYMLVRQALRIGNAATMINALAAIFLTKLSIVGFTNWLELTKNLNDGMNLLQRIISFVLSWDAAEFKASADSVKKAAKDKPTPAMLETLQQYIDDNNREQQVAMRAASLKNHQSIVTTIFKEATPPVVDEEEVAEPQHRLCMQYYSAMLSVRDRNYISAALCKTPPDMLTTAAQALVMAYDPIIRHIHEKINLNIHLKDLESFINELIKTSKPRKVAGLPQPCMPSVEDYIDLLMAYRHRLYKWIHAIGSQAPERWEELRTWSSSSIIAFRKANTDGTTNGSTTDSSVDTILQNLYSSVDGEKRALIASKINQHASYLRQLNATSQKRFQDIVTASQSADGHTNGGPGVYLIRWQALLDETLISAAEGKGTPRHGKDVKHQATMGKKGLGGYDLERSAAPLGPDVPDVSLVVEALGGQFKQEIQRLAAQKGLAIGQTNYN